MKKSVLAMLAAASVLSAVSLNANAAEGKVIFSGKVENAPCNIKTNSLSQQIDFGILSIENIKNSTTKVTPEDIPITLTDCDLKSATVKQPKITFSGQTETGKNDVLLTSGTAANVGIKVFNAGQAITWGTAVTPSILTEDTSGVTIMFSALPVALDGKAPTEGTFGATSTFTVDYQ